MTKKANERSQELESELMMNDPNYRNKVLAENTGWLPIETAPRNQMEMFIVRGFDAPIGMGAYGKYTTDAYAVWADEGNFIRWPHPFRPTHWMPLPPAPAKEPK